MRCECGGNVTYDSALYAYVCTSCGLVIEDRPIVPDSPRRSEEPRYSGTFTHRVHNNGIGYTVISGSIREHVKMGRTWVLRQVDMLRSRVVRLLRQLNKVSSALNVPSYVAETAAMLARKYYQEKQVFLSRTSALAISIASIYASLKMHGYPANLREIVAKLGAVEYMSYVWRTYMDMCITLNLRLVNASHPVNYVHKVATSVGAPPDVVALALHILKHIDGAYGRTPVSLSSGAIYLASVILNKRINQCEFEKAGTSDTGVRRGFNFILSKLNIEVFI